MRVAGLALAALALAGCTAPPMPPPEGPAAPAPAGPPALYSGADLERVVEVLKDSPREEARTVLAAVAPHIRTWNGTRYANLTGRANLDGGGVEGHRWSVSLWGRFEAGREDIYHAVVSVVDGTPRVLDGAGPTYARAFPQAHEEAAVRIFEASDEGADIRRCAPHRSPDGARWLPAGAVRLHYTSIPPGVGGFPEHPMASIEVSVPGEKVTRVEKSEWWC